MTTLYIAWQDPQTRYWHTVGRLTKEQDMYHFVYTNGALASSRFSYFGRMFDLHKPYYSRELFPLFANRVLNRSRSEYPDYLRWLALNPDIQQEPMQLLARSGGKRRTDELYVFPHPELGESGRMVMYFLSHGLRYLDDSALLRIASLKEGESLSLRHETDNRHDQYALLLETDELVKVGYCPRYLNRDLKDILNRTDIHLSVERLNIDAPLQFRLLCKVTFKLPLGVDIFASEEYKPTTQQAALITEVA